MTDRWDIPDLEPFERVGWEEQQREWPEDEREEETPESDPKPPDEEGEE